MKRTTAALLLVLACGTSSCAWDSQWMWRCSSLVYSGDGACGCVDPCAVGSHSGSLHEAREAGILIGVLLILPIAIDLLSLPVTGLHDWNVCD